ncbi:MAG: saccharopine dehydrogenase C-terminal domain-containing protein, partial [Rhodothermales bacterium]|nr:saccharopine dehydrogenase C-terminal domain-containing protein [Rhodothermales bacterium]
MKVLLLGVGMQGAVALDDLVQSDDVTEVTAADVRIEALRDLVGQRRYGDVVQCAALDAADESSLDALFAERPDVAIDLLPVDYIPRVADAAIRHGVPLVNTFFVSPELRARAAGAAQAGVAILPEFGMDPGIDLVLLGESIRGMDEVHEIHSYGGGIPTPEAATNTIRYKVSWTLKGVLQAYHHPSRIRVGGREVRIAADRLFHPEHVHTVEVEGLGELEAYTNGDAIGYCDELGID